MKDRMPFPDPYRPSWRLTDQERSQMCKPAPLPVFLVATVVVALIALGVIIVLGGRS